MNGKLYPIEIKLTATPTAQHLAPLNKLRSIVGDDMASHGILVCRVEKRMELQHNNIALPWQEFSQWLFEQLSGFGSDK
jgi:uncharacterized protein